MGEEQQRNRWVEHFEELLNRQAPQNPPDIEPSKKPSIVWIAKPSGSFSDTTGYPPRLSASSRTRLNIHKGKNKILKTNAASNNPITLDGKALEEAFTYLGSVIDKQGGTDTDVKARIGKARATFIQLRNIWSSKELSVKTKVFSSTSRALRTKPARLKTSLV
nr:hypothetical protein BaRGS_011801 [Batillaria attramentaria]